MHRVPRVGSLVCIANMKKKKKTSAKTYDNDLTRTINSHEADPSSSHEFENFFFFSKRSLHKIGLLDGDNTHVHHIEVLQ